MLFKGVICLGTLLLVFESFHSTEAQQNKKSLASTKGIETFAYELLFRTAIKSPNKNIVLSPFSVWAMLTVLSEGSAGQTKQELMKTLRHPKGPKGAEVLRDNFKIFSKAFNVRTNTIDLETTNFIFLNRQISINPNYRDLVTSTYLTDVIPTDFQNAARTTNEINGRVSQATKGKIKQIVSQDDMRNAQMILINAIFFRGQWTMPFNTSLTTRDTFYDENNRPLGQVNMMYQRGPYPYVNSPEFKAHVVEIPYGKENRLSMVVVVPKNGVKLTEIFEVFTKVDVSKLFEALTESAELYPDDEVDLYLPRFSITSEVNLNAILNDMGIFEAFDPQWADFASLTSNNNLYLSLVIHKAQIEVTEEGTVASAVTAGELSNRNTPPKIVANKPFFYMIVEKNTNVVVFGGVYVYPETF